MKGLSRKIVKLVTYCVGRNRGKPYSIGLTTPFFNDAHKVTRQHVLSHSGFEDTHIVLSLFENTHWLVVHLLSETQAKVTIHFRAKPHRALL
jgi:hypothetical protein